MTSTCIRPFTWYLSVSELFNLIDCTFRFFLTFIRASKLHFQNSCYRLKYLKIVVRLKPRYLVLLLH